jgi:hypothetical protein
MARATVAPAAALLSKRAECEFDVIVVSFLA